MTGSAFKAMDVVVACCLMNREEVRRRGGSKFTRTGGQRMTGSALKRWTLYWDCFSERMLELGGGPGGGELIAGPGGRDADDGKRSSGGGRCIGIASRRECWNWEGVQGEGSSKFDRIGGIRMTGSAFKAMDVVLGLLLGENVGIGRGSRGRGAQNSTGREGCGFFRRL